MENKVVDALSRRKESSCATISVTQANCLEEIHGSLSGDELAQELLIKLMNNPSATGDYTLHQGFIRHQREIVYRL